MKMIEKFFRDKKSNTVIYIVLAVGIVMLVSAGSMKHSETSAGTVLPDSKSVSLNSETENILSEIDGVGEVCVMMSCKDVKTESMAKSVSNVQSVLVVADGGDNPAVREKIVRALKVALGVDAHKIEVFERKERK